ncbi:MAG TPA: DUF502 domain-containing protein [Bacillota bacterium]|nr:DUF502 domain-containing protein [Bacillota bacterium]
MKWVRKYFLTGLFVILPVIITLELLWWVFQKTDAILGNFIARYLPIPGLGLVTLLLLILLVGITAQNYLGKKLIALSERFLKKIPILNGIYGVTKQFTESLTQANPNAFRHVVMIEYPRPGVYSPGFLTGEAPSEISSKAGARLLSVFVPTVPNPTTGYLVYIPETQVTILEMSIEDGFKLLVSAGVIKPASDSNGIPSN